MNRSIAVACLCAFLVTLPAQSGDAAIEPAVGARAVETWLGSYSTTVNAGDSEAFGRLWAAGADWAPPDAPLLRGHDAILGFARALFEKYTVSHSFTAQGFKVVEGLGVAVITAAERYTPKAGGAPWEQNVKGVIILRRDEDGVWRGTHFIWNRNAPAKH